MARLQHAEADERLTLELVRHADRRGLEDRGMLDQHRLDLRRPEPLARDLDGVVRASQDVPQTVFIDGRPVAVNPRVGEP